jgi:hypothetical protein
VCKTHSREFCALMSKPRRVIRITPHQERILSHPMGETQPISPHHDTRTGEPQTTCAGKVGRNSASFAPREKRKKLLRRKSSADATTSTPRLRCRVVFSENVAHANGLILHEEMHPPRPMQDQGIRHARCYSSPWERLGQRRTRVSIPRIKIA